MNTSSPPLQACLVVALMAMTGISVPEAEAGPLTPACSLSDIDWTQPLEDALEEMGTNEDNSRWGNMNCTDEDLVHVGFQLFYAHGGCMIYSRLADVCVHEPPTGYHVDPCNPQRATFEVNYQRSGQTGEIHIYGYNPVSRDEIVVLLAWDASTQNMIAMAGCDRYTSSQPLRDVDVLSWHKSGLTATTSPVTRTVTIPDCPLNTAAVDPDWTGTPSRSSFGYDWGEGQCITSVGSELIEYGLEVVGAPEQFVVVPTTFNIEGDLYVDRYKTGSLVYPCVTGEARVDGSPATINPCIGDFDSRFLTLLYEDSANLPLGDPLSLIDICDAELTVMFLGFGVDSMGGFRTVC